MLYEELFFVLSDLGEPPLINIEKVQQSSFISSSSGSNNSNNPNNNTLSQQEILYMEYLQKAKRENYDDMVALGAVFVAGNPLHSTYILYSFPPRSIL